MSEIYKYINRYINPIPLILVQIRKTTQTNILKKKFSITYVYSIKLLKWKRTIFGIEFLKAYTWNNNIVSWMYINI